MILKNKKVILTGAGGGIGSVIADKLAEEGAAIVLIDLVQLALEETLKKIKVKSSSSFYIVTDISTERQVKTACEEIDNKIGDVDVLVNSAGVQAPIGNFYLNDLEKWKKNIEVNLLGTVNFTYHVLSSMMKKKKGKIINFSGGGSTSPRPALSAYAVAKTAVVRFTETIAEELKDYNIDVNAVAPGAINTKMLDEVLQAGESSGKEYFDALKRKDEGGNSPELVADLICFLASEKSDGITGKLISAPWDPWINKDFQELLRTDKDFGTLRRIDNKTFFKKT